MSESETSQERINVDTGSLASIALFLEGVKLGRGGNIRPLGNWDLENLWHAIHYLRGDVRYKCEEHEKE